MAKSSPSQTPSEMERLTITPDEPLKDTEITIDHTDRRRCLFGKIQMFLLDNLLLLLTGAGIIIGFTVGFGVRELHPSKDALMWIGMPGELFLRMLKLMIVPLIVCSVITGTASMDPKINGKISAVAFLFIVITNVIACVVAVVFCLLIRPGEGGSSDTSGNTGDEEPVETQDIFADLLRNLIPDNMIAATFRKSKTSYVQTKENVVVNATNGTTLLDTVVTLTKVQSNVDGINVLGLIVFCTVFGMGINKVKSKAKFLLDFFAGATEVIIVIIRWFFWLTPVGVASLVAVSIASVGNVSSTFSQLGKFVLAVSVGILLHQFVVLPAIMLVTTRRNPFTFLISIVRPTMIGFAATSTAVAIPEMLDACEQKNKIDSRVSRFVIPFCVTLNADGSALYITSAAIFIAQLTGVGADTSTTIIIGILTAVAAMAIPSVPSASIVTLVIILTSLNIPVRDIALLFAVEWFLDRLRTACNVISHTFCAAITYHYCKKDLQRSDMKMSMSRVETAEEIISTMSRV